MIKAILVFNNHGKPRLLKFYHHYPEEEQQHIVRETFQLVSKRDDNVCNFLEGGSLIGGSDYKLIYRHYATLYFVFCVDSSESELGILDLIQVHHILSELVMGGMVLETNMNEILIRIQEQEKLEKQEWTAGPQFSYGLVMNSNSGYGSTNVGPLKRVLQWTAGPQFSYGLVMNSNSGYGSTNVGPLKRAQL
ncbi:AP-3 complex subunit sigma-2 [Toxocara canis]|uniref:AP-3 complex subunit sigma-2 n=1 Tax=Toxocara canis TaxID=6265 RepID=A0A0B2VT72_TOXCA|nr:AP-3 complex subunit sigma-2 [Toxocara canis]